MNDVDEKIPRSLEIGEFPKTRVGGGVQGLGEDFQEETGFEWGLQSLV